MSDEVLPGPNGRRGAPGNSGQICAVRAHSGPSCEDSKAVLASDNSSHTRQAAANDLEYTPSKAGICYSGHDVVFRCPMLTAVVSSRPRILAPVTFLTAAGSIGLWRS